MEEGILIAEFHRKIKFNPKNVYNLVAMFNTRYKIYAYPGPDVIKNGRAEHLPLHVHAFDPNNLEFRINCQTLGELDNQPVPRIIRKYVVKHQIELTEKAYKVYHYGRLDKKN